MNILGLIVVRQASDLEKVLIASDQMSIDEDEEYDEDDNGWDEMSIDESTSTQPSLYPIQARMNFEEFIQDDDEMCSTITSTLEESYINDVSDHPIQGGRHPAMSLSHICNPPTDAMNTIPRDPALDLATICSGELQHRDTLKRNKLYELDTICCDQPQHQLPRNRAYELSAICNGPDEYQKPRNSAYELSTICSGPVQHKKARNSAYDIGFSCNQRKVYSLASICN